MAHLTVTATAAEAAGVTADRMAAAIGSARGERRTAHLALAGGNTPVAAYERLAGLIDDWSGVELWLGDERMVPRTDPESNYRMLTDALLARTGADAHAVDTSGSAEDAAEAYGRLLRDRAPSDADGVPRLDFALLGLGEDGHTASLFPRHPALEQTDSPCIAVHDSPKPPPDRVTLSLQVLRGARGSAILAVGRAKAEPAAATLRGPNPDVPASLLADGPLELILDSESAGGIPVEERT